MFCAVDGGAIHAAQIVVADDGSSPGCRDIVPGGVIFLLRLCGSPTIISGPPGLETLRAQG